MKDQTNISSINAHSKSNCRHENWFVLTKKFSQTFIALRRIKPSMIRNSRNSLLL